MPSAKALGKRKAQPETRPKDKHKKVEKKTKLRDRKTIPIPKSTYEAGGSEDDELEDDYELDDDLGDVAGFISSADPSALSRSIKETRRLHDLAKSREPLPKQSRIKPKLPSLGSASTGSFDSDAEFPSDLEDVSDLESLDDDSEVDGLDSMSSDSDAVDYRDRRKRKKEANEEADYERAGRQRMERSLSVESDSVQVSRLPIKLPSGQIQKVEGSTKITLPPTKKPRPPTPESTEESEEELEPTTEELTHRMASQKGKFGRLGIAEIAGRPGWKNADRLAAAKEQIASTGAEILAGGELIDTAPLLTRLSTFSLPTVPSPDDGSKLPVPASIRGLAFLSLLAVYKDIIPGYRIRQLTALEEAEKVRDEVKRQREGEKLLVNTYKAYLKTLETEIKARSTLASLCLGCMCELLTAVPHFNFSENIMGVLVGRVARKTWDDDAELVFQTVVKVFKADVSAHDSQILVRLIARMIKERKYQVHPKILGSLLHLRLVNELDPKRETKRDERDRKGTKMKAKFKSDVREKWRTKNQKKRDKELKEIKKEMAEAEAEVNEEERSQVQTETLKNLFVLYFSILKHPTPTPLLAPALEGISQFAHHINIDFFKDLLVVLRRLIVDDADDLAANQRVRLRLIAIITAFDLLSGQGEALNIDLTDFVNALFALLRPLALDTGIEDPPDGTVPSRLNASTSALMFECIETIFFSRVNKSSMPPWRLAAFAKRLTESALLLPPQSALKALEIVRTMMIKESKLEGMLDTEERMFDGVYKPELDDPQLTNPLATSLWEVEVLAKEHWDRRVRTEASKLREAKF
ncbi:CBF/Mak21 family-domain-containing protein [Kockovaella imperatae]|uniref:Nucleolar complex-associated protein 3 n=1 Tax=Kockovaella imperatae TaxID=4999 RepID=A0A1Y1UR09_9TREE|nr:CBF/Mak21 family-domain-containing protein [Kockovaella imperatae]ORX40518.1 CBF/Mak21 family-domain-containing protein [Kockovaella imperatae]